MLKIPIYLRKFGIGEPEELASIIIWNDATGTKSVGNYKYKITHKNKEIGSGEVKSFPRLRKNSVELLYLVLKSFYENIHDIL